MRLTELRVELGERAYPIRIGADLIEHAAAELGDLARADRLVVVSEDRVWSAQGARLLAGLQPVEAVPLLVPGGEGAKNWSVLADLVDRLLDLRVERGDHLVAFGGGVIGDLTGFAAAIYKRGIPYLQVPTSLLAQVDASVGGKTGINTGTAKNMVGAFHQPARVLVDPSCLATLAPRHLRSGYAEIVKYALIEDAPFFEWLEANGSALLAGDSDALHHAIAVSIAGKARIVAADELETNGRRALLNLGHTFAHALEAETGFSDRLLHGEAVALGLVLAFDLSAARGLCPAEDASRVRAHLRSLGLPTSLGQVALGASPELLVGHMLSDKKAEGGRPALILARRIGQAFVDRTVGLAEVEALLARTP